MKVLRKVLLGLGDSPGLGESQPNVARVPPDNQVLTLAVQSPWLRGLTDTGAELSLLL